MSVQDLRLRGADDRICAFSGAPRLDVINVGLCLPSFFLILISLAKRSLRSRLPPSNPVKIRNSYQKREHQNGVLFFVYAEKFCFFKVFKLGLEPSGKRLKPKQPIISQQPIYIVNFYSLIKAQGFVMSKKSSNHSDSILLFNPIL